MNTITIDKAVLEQALEALEAKQAMLIKIAKLLCEITGEPILELGDSESITALRRALEQQYSATSDHRLMEQPAQQTCNCRWEGNVQVQQCALHEAHVDAIHEWAERAKTAEAKLKEQPAQQEPVAWMYFDSDGDAIFGHPNGYRPDNAVPVYTHPQVIDKSAAIRIATALGWEPKREPLTDEEIDRAIAELGLNYLADAANNRSVLRELCRRAAHGITGETK